MTAAPDTLFAAALAHHRAGRTAEARERCERLLAQAPDHDGALHLLGVIAFREGEAGRAAALFGQAAGLALARGEADTALQRAVEALTAQETRETRRLFAGIAGALRFAQDDPVVRPLLIRALEEGWGPPGPLARAAAGLVREARGDDALLQAALAAAPIADAALEEILIRKRRALLAGGADSGFAAALARQCFLNGYVFAQDREEIAQVAALRARAESGDASALPALACYVPLGEVAGAEKFAGGEDLAAVLKQQRDEPAEEKRLAAQLPALTPLTDAAEPGEDPFPRWSGKPAPETPMALRDYLAARFPFAALDGLPERPSLLVAGCGTGEYALHLAGMLVLESVTAIDLSRANLGFAARKAKEAGLDIRFGRGDMHQAAALGRFGAIECGGVLHHLPDPLAGWSALLEALEPGGVMRIAVHSQTARAALAPIRRKLAEAGFDATPDGIRAARPWLRRQRDTGLQRLLEAPEFFTLGGCRQLFFPEAEHPLSLARIGAFLRENRLVLLGLDVAPALAAAYRDRFPGDAAATDLDNWAAFEQESPRSFAAMVQFWVRKAG